MPHASTTFSVLRSSIGAKALMAVTGVVLFGFVLGHMVGNLQVFAGPERLNGYAKTLHSMPALVWIVRLTLLFALVLHIVASVKVAIRSKRARPERYHRVRYGAATYASRTMRLSGPIIAAFVIYHLMHFTTGNAHPSFQPGDVYHNVVVGFSNPLVSGFYILAQILLATHLFHGVWSLFQTLGLNRPGLDRRLRTGAALFATVVAVGNISMPVAVLAGLVR
ncbi:MAG: succinate dehydrogenase cytochrome b subunit [Deltaproteobacteria bacterium]|nr:succinate dehydrogenase cytochrome b subunit [Deltaproteobacteria bacterium]